MITALLFSVLTGSVAAQPDDGWLAWQGCWRPTDAEVSSLLCIVPDGNGIKMITMADGVKRSEVTLIADGVARPISQEDPHRRLDGDAGRGNRRADVPESCRVCPHVVVRRDRRDAGDGIWRARPMDRLP